MKLRFAALLVAPLLLQACGGTQVIPGQSNGDISQYKAAYIASIAISTDDGNADEIAETKKMEAQVRSKIEAVMAEKHLVAVDAATANKVPTLAFNYKSTVHFGSRAARWAAGFTSAGKGIISSQFEAVDSASKKVVYSASAESELKVGVFGGGMGSVIETNVDELFEAFSEHK